MTRLALFVACCLLVASCKTTGPAGDRFSFRYQWLSYLAGDDIRELCSLGSQDRLRLIYNADFNNETRTFDFVASPDGSSRRNRAYRAMKWVAWLICLIKALSTSLLRRWPCGPMTISGRVWHA